MASTEQKGFVHSTPVPRIYKIASKVARNVKEGRDSLKNLVYAEKHVNIKTLYALVVEVFKRNDLIDEVIHKSNLLVEEPRFDIWLAKVLISELLWGKNKMSRGSKPIDIILKYEKNLRSCLENCVDSIQPVSMYNISKPRYVRVNTLKISMEEAIGNFKEEGWRFVPYFNRSDYTGYQSIMMNLKEDEFMKDIHIPELLIFPSRTEFYQHEAYKSGHIILQDKASCLPVHLLAPPPGSIVLDTCAAPGMKTTQIAALLGNNGKVYAVELNPRREALMKKLADSVEATCVQTILKDVMQVTADDCPDVEYILVDPSCSGSGITDRIELEKLDLGTKMARLRKLSNFQAKLLRYSMNAFPKVKRIVYSTCSVNSEENEDVVRQTLETSRKFKLIDAKKLLPSWNTKTSDLYPELGNMCIYATPEEDKTNGFFVAVFERLEEGEKNPYLNFQLCKLFDKELRKIRNNNEPPRDEMFENNCEEDTLTNNEEVNHNLKKKYKEENDELFKQKSGTLEEKCKKVKKRKTDGQANENCSPIVSPEKNLRNETRNDNESYEKKVKHEAETEVAKCKKVKKRKIEELSNENYSTNVSSEKTIPNKTKNEDELLEKKVKLEVETEVVEKSKKVEKKKIDGQSNENYSGIVLPENTIRIETKNEDESFGIKVKHELDTEVEKCKNVKKKKKDGQTNENCSAIISPEKTLNIETKNEDESLRKKIKHEVDTELEKCKKVKKKKKDGQTNENCLAIVSPKKTLKNETINEDESFATKVEHETEVGKCKKVKKKKLEGQRNENHSANVSSNKTLENETKNEDESFGKKVKHEVDTEVEKCKKVKKKKKGGQTNENCSVIVSPEKTLKDETKNEDESFAKKVKHEAATEVEKCENVKKRKIDGQRNENHSANVSSDKTSPNKTKNEDELLEKNIEFEVETEEVQKCKKVKKKKHDGQRNENYSEIVSSEKNIRNKIKNENIFFEKQVEHEAETEVEKCKKVKKRKIYEQTDKNYSANVSAEKTIRNKTKNEVESLKKVKHEVEPAVEICVENSKKKKKRQDDGQSDHSAIESSQDNPRNKTKKQNVIEMEADEESEGRVEVYKKAKKKNKHEHTDINCSTNAEEPKKKNSNEHNVDKEVEQGSETSIKFCKKVKKTSSKKVETEVVVCKK